MEPKEKWDLNRKWEHLVQTKKYKSSQIMPHFLGTWSFLLGQVALKKIIYAAQVKSKRKNWNQCKKIEINVITLPNLKIKR